MNPDLEKLIELQRVEREIARLTAEVAALPKRMAAIEAQLADTKSQVERTKSAISANLTDRRKQEQKIQDEQQKISRYRDQSLGVKTNEQYKALLQEIQFAESEIRACEDRILEGMVGNEELEKKLKAAEAELKAEAAEIEKEKVEARAVTAKDEAELAAWTGQQDRLRAAIAPAHLAYYDRVAGVRKNALAEARDHKCSACQVMLRPQTYNEVRTNSEIMACDSCQRILYYDTSKPEEETTSTRRIGKRGHRVEKAWYYLADSGYGSVFVAYVNHLGSCSRRYFDADDGRFLHIDRRQEADFGDVFQDEIHHGLQVYVEQQPNLEETCHDQLPADVLAELRRQVQATEEPIQTPGQ
ncbi:MAG TPA: C4-type zinc ribbon domain-containing protein [Terriglobales bacterium]|nr:C4-type zinc ribbon domain-containing protein [Terriglobales bacterium]